MSTLRMLNGDLKTPVDTFYRSDTVIILPGLLHIGPDIYYKQILKLLSRCTYVFSEEIRPLPNDAHIPLEKERYKDLLETFRGAYRKIAGYLGYRYQGDAMNLSTWTNADISLDYLINNSSTEFLDRLQKFGEPFKRFEKAYINDPEALSAYLVPLFIHTAIKQDTAEDKTSIQGGGKESGSETGTDVGIGGIFIDDRNQSLFNIIEPCLDEKGSIGIPWGISHMPGIQSYLKSHGFTQGKRTWVTAWYRNPKLDFIDAYERILPYL